MVSAMMLQETPSARSSKSALTRLAVSTAPALPSSMTAVSLLYGIQAAKMGAAREFMASAMIRMAQP
ncbi:hypothetical protein AYJ57_25320 (plasmid) [Salipiger sp. CCB-MM3]|nr:hypothetical protein AYJ57_25320 [Salipiger sp. CCB-MM3]